MVTGRKHYIIASAFADFAIVMCVTDPDKGADGVSAILLDLDRPGVSLSLDYLPMPGQHVDADINMQQVRVPVANLTGKKGSGFKIAMNRVSVNRLLHCLTMTGLAWKAYRLAVDYAHRRHQLAGSSAAFKPFNICWPTWRQPCTPGVFRSSAASGSGCHDRVSVLARTG